MPNYRRWHVPGGTYFFTVVTYNRQNIFARRTARQLLSVAMREVKANQPYQMIASVLLWDHLHCVWTLPHGDCDYSRRWKKIKAAFTQRWLTAGGSEASVTEAQAKRGNRGVWQKRFWEHVVASETELEQVYDYIHYNPVKHGYAEQPWNWRFSSFRRFVSVGQYEPSWGRNEPESIRGLDFEFGK